MDERRRDFPWAMTSAAGAALVGCGADGHGRVAARQPGSGGEAEVTPGEDLMQEHGLLERILLVDGEAARRLEGGERVDLAIVGDAADIVRRFVEDYHEKLEERHLFPRLERAEVQSELVTVQRHQHARGREVALGFTGAVAEVVRLEEALGIADLARFTA